MRNFWSEKEKRSFIRDRELVQAINNGNENIASLIAIGRIMGHVKQGKITLRSSYHYQDLRNKIKNVEIKECNGFLNSEILEKLVSGRFVVDIQNRIEGLDVINKTDDIEPDEDDKSPTWVNFSDVLTGCKETKKFTFNF